MKWISDQIEWLKSFFSEPDTSGKASMKRLISFFVVAAYLFSYMKTSIINLKLEDIPINWAFLIAGLLGLGTLDAWVKKDKPNA